MAYDPVTESWTQKADMPTARFFLSACVVDGRIYAIGGRLDSDACTANEVYDPITDTWTTKSPMQQKRNGAFVCSIADKIYAIGGAYNLPSPTFLLTAEEYDVPSPDFNADGIVNFIDFSQFAQYFLQGESSVDMAPTPFADGMADCKDLAVFCDNWLKESLPVGVIAWWKLNETEGHIAHDSAGDFHATLINGPVWQSTGGKIEGALLFDGMDDYVNAGFVLNPADRPFSAFAWIKGGQPGGVIISQTDTGGFGATWLGADPPHGKLMTNLMYFEMQSELVITDEVWHHVGIVWDGSRRYLYVDGQEVAKDTTDGVAVPSSGDLYIGTGKELSAGTFWSGVIDDVNVYDRGIVP